MVNGGFLAASQRKPSDFAYLKSISQAHSLALNSMTLKLTHATKGRSPNDKKCHRGVFSNGKF